MIQLALFGQISLIQNISGTPSQWILLFSSLLITVSGAFRLAKFNTDDRQTESFLGMPIPANAIFFASLGLIIELGEKPEIASVILNKYTLLASIFVCSFLMVSEIPMFSLKFKNLKLKENGIRFLFIGVIVLMLAILGLYALPLIIVWYVLLSLVGMLTNKS